MAYTQILLLLAILLLAYQVTSWETSLLKAVKEATEDVQVRLALSFPTPKLAESGSLSWKLNDVGHPQHKSEGPGWWAVRQRKHLDPFLSFPRQT